MAEYANPDKLVSTDWVAARLDDPGVCLIEVDVDTGAYDEGHPPGATAWNWTSQLQDQVRRDVADRETVEALLRGAGANDDSRIVLFGDNNNWFAAYALWMLEKYGVDNTALMDGGRVKWLAEGRPTTTEAPDAGAGTIAVGERNESIRAKLPDVLDHVNAGGQLVDVRSPRRIQRRDHGPARPGRNRPAQGPRARRLQHPLGHGSGRGRHVQVRRRAGRDLRQAGELRATNPSSPTAASASAPPTAGSPSATSSASTR